WQEQGGAGAEVQLLELQLLVRQGRRGHAPGRSQSHPRAQAARAADHQTQRRAEPENRDRGVATLPAGLEALLPAGGYAERLRCSRQVASPPSTRTATQAVAARPQGLRRAA